MVAGCLMLAGCGRTDAIGHPGPVQLEDDERVERVDGWQRIDSRYCTILVDEGMDVRHVSGRVKTWMIRPQTRRAKGEETPAGELAAKCDTIFRQVLGLLDMYPPGIHVTLKVTHTQDEIKGVHAALYGYGTEAIAFYVYEENAIYTTLRDLSTSVLAHEIAHCVVDHYFQVRPPRKVEEMLATYVDAHL